MGMTRFLSILLAVILTATTADEVQARWRIRLRPVKPILVRDLLRDRTIRPRRINRPVTLFRYTTRERAREELKKGLAPGTHMTAPGGPGRPLSSATARRRYGLPRNPQVRETIRLPAGTPVRSARVLGGKPGYGETVAVQRLHPKVIRRVISLNPGKSRHAVGR